MANNADLKFQGLSGTAIINGVALQSCDYALFFGSTNNQKSYRFSLFFSGVLSNPRFGDPRYWLYANLMDNITNSFSARYPASLYQEFVGDFERTEGDPREAEREFHCLNELNFRLDNTVLKITGKTCTSMPEHLSNWEFDITVTLNEEMIQLLRSVPPINHDNIYHDWALRALHARLHANDIPAVLETCVQIKPFRTQAKAQAACAKLKALGIDWASTASSCYQPPDAAHVRYRGKMPDLRFEGLSGATAIINGVALQSSDYTLYFRSVKQMYYDFSLVLYRDLSKPSSGGDRYRIIDEAHYYADLSKLSSGGACYWLSADLMDNITNSPSARHPASPYMEFVGYFKLEEGDPREAERRYLNEINFRLDNTSLNITGKTCASRPEHLSHWEFDITVMLNEKMVKLLRRVPPIDHNVYHDWALRALHARLRANGIPAALETHVQVGPFRTQAEAQAACVKLKALDIDGIIVPPHAYHHNWHVQPVLR